LSTAFVSVPRDPAYARFASFGEFQSAEARSAKAESGDPDGVNFWISAYAEKDGVKCAPTR